MIDVLYRQGESAENLISSMLGYMNDIEELAGYWEEIKEPQEKHRKEKESLKNGDHS